MIEVKIIRGRSGKPAAQRSDTFTGRVYGDPVMERTDGVAVNSVCFSPSARTYWHRHEGGQLLQVTSGQGRVQGRDGDAVTVRAGDSVWIAPGEEHWHGADEDSYLVHVSISLGTTEWLDEVTDDEYRDTG